MARLVASQLSRWVNLQNKNKLKTTDNHLKENQFKKGPNYAFYSPIAKPKEKQYSLLFYYYIYYFILFFSGVVLLLRCVSMCPGEKWKMGVWKPRGAFCFQFVCREHVSVISPNSALSALSFITKLCFLNLAVCDFVSVLSMQHFFLLSFFSFIVFLQLLLWLPLLVSVCRILFKQKKTCHTNT